MKFYKKNLKFIVSLIVGIIIGSTLSVYAAYSYLAQDVSYTKSDGTEVSIKDALDQLNEKSQLLTYYAGCYADVNDDGTIDGVIFIDLAYGASWRWGSSQFGITSYSFSAVTSGLKEYYVKNNSYTDSSFGTHPVIAPVSGTSGKDRFYVMTLSDYNNGKSYNWSNACNITQTVGSVTFKLPSQEEWAAFLGKFVITKSNYSYYDMQAGGYWTSNAYDDEHVMVADILNECFSEITAYWNEYRYIRLRATF